MSLDDDALRDAARHLVAAGRSFLDAVDAAIDDPELLRRMSDVIVGLGRTLGDLATDVVGGRTDEGP